MGLLLPAQCFRGYCSMSAVIRMPGANGKRTIHLLGGNDGGELVRQRDAPERQQQIGACSRCGGPSIGRPDCQHYQLCAGIDMARELAGEF